MSINNDVMINAIQSELNKRGRTQRLLPKDIARNLWNVLKSQGYERVSNSEITDTRTLAKFTQAQCNRIKVSFSVVN